MSIDQNGKMNSPIAPGQIYHVLNRGVDKRNIFLEKKDYLRFIYDLIAFNTTEPVENLNYTFSKNPMDIGRRYRQKKLLDILAFCLMPNHYHLLLIPHSKEALSLFMKKLNMGYAKYFNEKNQRNGALFQGKYKAILISEEAHFIHIPYYIHLNPLDLVNPEWRERRISNYKKAMEFLSSYRWSSHLDYLGKTNFPAVINRKLLLEYFGGTKEYAKEVADWLRNLNLEDENLKPLLLE